MSPTTKPRRRRQPPPPVPPSRRLSWCCSFTHPPHSPDNPPTTFSPFHLKKTDLPSKSSLNSIPPSPQSQSSNSAKIKLVTRILSPGRVSPINDVTTHQTLTPPIPMPPSPLKTTSFSETLSSTCNEANSGVKFDVRMSIKGRNGGNLVLELNSEVLVGNSVVFGDLIGDYRKSNLGGDGLFRIEVPEVDNLTVFRETIELMFEEDISKRVVNLGVYRAIDVLEVAAGIKFNRGVSFCLKYIEAMPWTEEEEEKLKILFSKYQFDDAITKDICARLYTLDSAESQQNLTKQLVWSITTSSDNNSRNELKSLVRGLLSKSSIYVKNHDLNREDILVVCQSCVNSLNDLLREAAGEPTGTSVKKIKEKSLLERMSKQVDNINWLLEILLDHQMAEDFVNIWTNEKELLKLHENASPMIRYEVSRVSAVIFIAMGSRKLHCKSDERSKLLKAWFRPMLMDYGWLQRCKKGLDIKVLEEAMGQTLLTLPLKEQYALFMDWFNCFSKSGTECPNLSKAFQIWWRRSFLRGSETISIESR